MSSELSPSEALQRLLDFLHARNILISKDDIGWAFTSPKTAPEVIRFVRERINEENLLTLEEKEILEKLQLQLPDVETVPHSVVPKNERQIRQEVENLEAATAQFRRQTEALRKQKTILESLNKSNTALQNSQKRVNSSRRKKYDREKGQLTTAVEEILGDLSNIQRQERYSNTSNLMSFQSSKVNESLKADDRLLERVQGLILSTAIPNQAAMEKLIEHVRQLSARLTELKTSTIRTKLDRTFIEQAQKYRDLQEMEGSDQEKELVLSDLNSFHHDIPDVAGMVTKEVFLHPIMTHAQRSYQKRVSESAARFEMVTSVLLQLSEKNVSMANLLQNDSSRHEMLGVVVEKIKQFSKPSSQLALSEAKKTNLKNTQTGKMVTKISTVPSTPVRSKLKVAETTTITAAPQISSIELQLLRTLNISDHQNLTSILEQRTRKLNKQEDTFTSASLTNIDKVEKDLGGRLQRLHDAVWSDTKWTGGQPQLFDADLKNDLFSVDERLKTVAHDVAAMTKEVAERRDAARNGFVDIWVQDDG